jgi:FkbM family methyltransferase
MAGATGNVYCGLHEFEDMTFVLHLLRPGDLFVDVGANVGSYTVLAARVTGAHCIAIEPLPATFAHLEDNLRINCITHLTCALNVGLGLASGRLPFTSSFDTANHVSVDRDERVVEMEVRTLDDVVGDRVPSLIKIDVEGFETQVLAGGARTLRHPDLIGVILELNRSGARYGHSDEQIIATMNMYGFEMYRYMPLKRTLERSGSVSSRGNALFMKRADVARQRVTSAPGFLIHGRQI